MGRFSIKQLMGSTALFAAAIWMFELIVRHKERRIELLLWFVMIPAFAAAIYNLSGRPFRGAAIGIVVANVATLSVLLIWTFLN
jgi:hypothetical protein